MAHELEITADGTTSFAYSLQHGSPWHRLGVPIDGLSDVDTILTLARADYQVNKEPLFTPDPSVGIGSALTPNGRPMLDTGKYYTWRTRPIWMDDRNGPQGGDAHVLGVVGKDYGIIQNRTVAELAVELTGRLPEDPTVDCAGVLDDGRRFFLTIPLPSVTLDPDGAADLHVRNLVATTGHDGNWALQLVNSTIRAVCANTVSFALSQRRHQVSIRHTGEFELTDAMVKQALGLAVDAGDEFKVLGERLLSQPCTFDLVKVVHDKVWGREEAADTDRKRRIRANRLTTLEVLWESETNTGAVGANRWAALNTFSEYFEHRASFAGSKRPGARAERSTQGGSLSDRVHKVGQILQAI